jgi:hypothetical protein
MNMRKGVFGFNMLIPLAIVLAVTGLILVFTTKITGGVRDTQTLNSLEYNVSTKTLAAQTEVSNWQSTLAVVGVAIVIIGALMMLSRVA